MSVAIRTATRIQDMDDANVTPAVGVDEYALTYDHDTAKFVLRAPASFDGTPYALLAGRAGGQTLYGGTAPNDDITIHGTSDATRTTSYVLLQPTAGNVGIGTSAPGVTCEVSSTLVSPSAQLRLTAPNLGSGSNVSFGIGKALSSGNMGFIAWDNQSPACMSVETYGGANPFRFYGTQVLVTNSNIYPASTGSALRVQSSTATNNAIDNVLTLGANVTGAGVGATGLGAGLLFQAESTTTADSNMAQIGALWTTATHATRASALTFSTLTAGGSLTESARIFRTSIGGYVKAIGDSWVELYSGQGVGGQSPGVLYDATRSFVFAACSADDHSGSVSARLSIATTGYVGLNTAAASSFLHVQGDIGDGITINDQNTPTVDKWMIHTGVVSLTRNGLSFSCTGTGGGGTSAPYLLIQNGGNVGIGDTAPAEKLDVTGNINTTGVVKVDDVQVLSNRVIDARCADVANSGDATTDGLIDALRDAMVAHGLIAAA